MVKNLPAIQETRVQSLGQEDVMEKGMATYSSTLAWRTPWEEEPGRLHAVHGIATSQTQLSDFTFPFHFPALEKEMATHSSVLAWRIPGTEEPGGLPSMGSHRVGHDWSDLAAAVAKYNIALKLPSSPPNSQIKTNLQNKSGQLTIYAPPKWTEEPGGLQSMGSERVRHD